MMASLLVSNTWGENEKLMTVDIQNKQRVFFKGNSDT